MKGANAAASRTTGLGTRSRISVEDKGSKVEERDVEGGEELVDSLLTGVVVVEVDIFEWMRRALGRAIQRWWLERVCG